MRNWQITFYRKIFWTIFLHHIIGHDKLHFYAKQKVHDPILWVQWALNHFFFQNHISNSEMKNYFFRISSTCNWPWKDTLGCRVSPLWHLQFRCNEPVSHFKNLFYFISFCFVLQNTVSLCGAFERKNDIWELKKIIYTHDTAIKNSQVHPWRWKIKI